MTEADVAHDDRVCLDEASYTKTTTIPHQWGQVRTNQIDHDAYRSCMEAKGYLSPGR